MAIRLDLQPEAITELVALSRHREQIAAALAAVSVMPPQVVVTVVDDTHQKLELEAKFVRLRDKWQSETSHISATSRRVLHSAYQSIIGMGQPAIPLILRELERNVDSWFWALAAITEDDPATPESMGNGELLADAWIAWCKQKGYVW